MIGSQHLKNYVIKINLLVSIIEILQVLAMEMSKAYSNVAPDIMNDIFENKKYYITSTTTVILFHKILNLYIMDQKDADKCTRIYVVA